MATHTDTRTLPDPSTLHFGAVDSRPVDFDWSEGYTETWDYLEAEECPACGAAIVDGTEHLYAATPVGTADAWPDAANPLTATADDLDDHELPEGVRWIGCEHEHKDAHDFDAGGPMMNYYYPVELDDTAEAARLLVDTPLVVVTIGGSDWSGETTGLALAGGGMDFSWQICEAFMRLGMLPPAHFCDLPNMAGMRATADNLAIVAACRRSLESVSDSALRSLSRLDALDLAELDA